MPNPFYRRYALTAALFLATPRPRPRSAARAHSRPSHYARQARRRQRPLHLRSRPDVHQRCLPRPHQGARRPPSVGTVYHHPRQSRRLGRGRLPASDGQGARVADVQGRARSRTSSPGTANCYNSIDSSQQKGKTESFLTLGFGGSGKDLDQRLGDHRPGPRDGRLAPRLEKLELVSPRRRRAKPELQQGHPVAGPGP